MMDGQKFGLLVRKHRGIEGMTQQELSISAFGDASNKSLISKLEGGRISRPQQKTIDALTVALHLSGDQIESCRTVLAPNQHSRKYREQANDIDEPLLQKVLNDLEAGGVEGSTLTRSLTHLAQRSVSFDPLPKVIDRRVWARIERGIQQRARATNALLYDIYHRQEIIRAGVLPAQLVFGTDELAFHMLGFSPTNNLYSTLSSMDIMIGVDGDLFLSSSNNSDVRGLSALAQSRAFMMNTLPDIFQSFSIEPVLEFVQKIGRNLRLHESPSSITEITAALLSEGSQHPLHTEDMSLADEWGMHLVEWHDVRVFNGQLCMRTTDGYTPINVLFNRISDERIDVLSSGGLVQNGIPGLIDVYLSGGVQMMNAPGASLADADEMQGYFDRIIEFYTGEPAILTNLPKKKAHTRGNSQKTTDEKMEWSLIENNSLGSISVAKGNKNDLRRLVSHEPDETHNLFLQSLPDREEKLVLIDGELSQRAISIRVFVSITQSEIAVSRGGIAVYQREATAERGAPATIGVSDVWIES